MDLVFKALADGTRRDLLDRLKKKDGQTLSELCEGFDASRQSITKHLNILEEANLVNIVWEGREKLHFLNPIPIREISRRWVSKFTKRRADALLDLKRSLEEKMSTKPEFNYVTFIAAPAEKVWKALTDPTFTKQYWFESAVSSDWKKGSTVSFKGRKGKEDLRGVIQKVDYPKELVYTFTTPNNEVTKDETSTVQFLLENLDGMTKLSVRHYGFGDGSKMFGMIAEGWPMLIGDLKTLLETGKTPGFTMWKGDD